MRSPAAGLVMYLPLFWDWIPTVMVHEYYCLTEQGLWVNKTVEQWQAENPGVAETLRWSRIPNSYKEDGIDHYPLNQRFLLKVVKREPVPLLSVQVAEYQIVDVLKSEVVVRLAEVSSAHSCLGSGAPGWWKPWPSASPCIQGRKEFSELTLKYKRQGRLESAL